MSSQPEIVIISHWFGHTPHCLECIMPFFLERGWQVYHLTDKPEAAARYFLECGLAGHEKIRHLGMLEVQPRKPTRRRDAQLCRVEAHWEGVRLALEGLFTELGRKVGIFHTWVDLYSHEYLSPEVIQRSLPAPWVGLYVHPAELRIQKTWKRRAYENAMDLLIMGRMFPSRLKAFNVPNARKIYFWDEEIPPLARRFFRASLPLGVLPEHTKLEPSRPDQNGGGRVGDEDGTLHLGLFGFLSKRKGLLTVARLARQRVSGWKFILAGDVDFGDLSDDEREEVLDFINKPPENCIVRARRCAEDEFHALIEGCDVVYVAYENFFHSSNIQIKAAHYGKPMIAGPRHLIAERTRRFGMGWCLPGISTAAVQELLGQIGVHEIREVRRTGKFEEFLSGHSPEVLEKKLDEIAVLVGVVHSKIVQKSDAHLRDV